MKVIRGAAGLLFFFGFIGLTPHIAKADIPGELHIFAWDSSEAATPPPFATAVLDGVESREFGTNDLVTFTGYYPAGTHTIEVFTAASGYLLRQSPTDPDAVNDPTSVYGNPRHIELSEATNTILVGFQFDPVVTASGTIRDALTMERLGNASIEFIFEGSSGDVIVNKYPSTASYASNWVSNSEGLFPTNTTLYLHNYDVKILLNGYEPFTSSNVIINASPGDAIDLGTLFLQPVDNNTNGIADTWESTYFSSGSNVIASADSDQDGMSNIDEYIAGTDPTNWYSYLWVEPISTSNEFYLAWYVEPDRTYRICGTTNLMSDTWVQVGGCWEATNGQVEMFWAETNHNLSWNNSYRVEVVPCGWQGTNQVLVRTNDWPTGGGGTNTWGGGLPPVP